MGAAALLLFAALAITVQKSAQCQTINVDLLQKGQITTFDGPGSFATSPEAINPAGVITGYYCQFLYCYGFLRTAEGAIITFDPPDANGYTYPYAINPAGTITGYYFDTGNVTRGFLRAGDGSFTPFAPPGAGVAE